MSAETVTGTASDLLAPPWPRLRLLGWLRIARAAVSAVLGFIVLIIPHLVWLMLRGPAPSPVARWYLMLVGWGAGLRTRRSGVPIPPKCLILANHISWTDILVLGVTVETAFVARADVRGWPGMGVLARLGGTIFVDRSSRRSTPAQVGEVAKALRRGRVALFPEGTTGNGSALLPFRPALLDGAADVAILPAVIRYRSLSGRPMNPQQLAAFAWDGDKEFLPHLAAIIASGGAQAELIALPPLPPDPALDRKQRASRARALIHSALFEA